MNNELIFTFDLPMPPSVNHAVKSNRFGARYLSRDYIQWKSQCNLLCRRFMEKQKVDRKNPILWRIFVTFSFNKLYRNDIDNRLKTLIDLLSDKLGVNDFYLTDITATKIKSKANKQERAFGSIVVYRKSSYPLNM